MEEQQKPRKALAPTPPPGYVLVADAKPLIQCQQFDSYYWAALAHCDRQEGVGLLLYTSIKVIDFLNSDEAVLLHISLADWLSTLLPYTSPEVACQIQKSCSDEEAPI